MGYFANNTVGIYGGTAMGIKWAIANGMYNCTTNSIWISWILFLIQSILTLVIGDYPDSQKNILKVASGRLLCPRAFRVGQ